MLYVLHTDTVIMIIHTCYSTSKYKYPGPGYLFLLVGRRLVALSKLKVLILISLVPSINRSTRLLKIVTVVVSNST